MSTPEAEKALGKAKIHLMASPNTTFFSTICCNVQHVWDERIPTACTNGLEIRYNPEFFLSYTPRYRVATLLHEILHIACEHMTRLNGRKPGKANRAMDYAINLIIKDAGFEIPQGWLIDEQYRGMSWEQIYDLLPDEPEDDNPDDLVFGDPGDVPAIQGQIDDMLVRAAQASQMAGDDPGSIPGDIQRYIDELTHPKIPWYRVLSSQFNKLAKVDRSLRKPNRRFFTRDIIMASRSGKQLDSGALATDVSCSVSQEHFTVYVSEARNLLKRCAPKTLHFLQFDTRVTSSDEISCLADMDKVKFTGGGGTRINPVMEWAKEHKPNWLVVFTDGEFNTPKVNPRVPVFWIIYDNPDFVAPFGKVIHFDIDQAIKHAD